MKSLLLIPFLIGLNFGVNAQISYSPEAPEATATIDTEKVVIYIDIINDLAMEQETFWFIDRETPNELGVVAPVEWEFQVCDKVTCYFWGIESCPEDRPNEFGANESWPYEFKLKPHGVKGIADVIFNITNSDGDILAAIPIHYEITGTSSIENIESTQVKVYPNPASDFINFENDDLVIKVDVYNLDGRKISSLDHKKGNIYDLSSLTNGIYLLKFFDQDNQLLTTSRISKN